MNSGYPLTILGDSGFGGTYILLIELAETITLTFGRFQKGMRFTLPAGLYIYVGSALGQKGASSLSYRLLRHVTRTGDKPPHIIRRALQNGLSTCGLPAPLPKRKTLRWHIDYLLDETAASLVHVAAIRSSLRLESPIACWLMARDGVTVPIVGLGAQDTRGETHLLHLAHNGVWESVLEQLPQFLDREMKKAAH